MNSLMRAIVFLMTLGACSSPPEQPDLNTYGAIQPLCILWCQIRTNLTEGDGATGTITSSVTTTDTKTAGVP